MAEVDVVAYGEFLGTIDILGLGGNSYNRVGSSQMSSWSAHLAHILAFHNMAADASPGLFVDG
jgi:hypothetical protein